MNIEIEAKMQLTDLAGVQQKLRSLDAKEVGTILETNTYFDTDSRSLKSTDQGLRIRVERDDAGDTETRITHKGPRAHGKLKSRSETEVAVADAHDAVNLLGALGYLPVLTFEKRRNRWQLDGCQVELDTLPYLGDFIEIEGPSDDAVLSVRKKLGLDETPLIHASYIAMLVSYVHEKHIRTDYIRFEK